MAAILNMQDGCFTRFCANANIDFLIGNSIKFKKIHTLANLKKKKKTYKYLHREPDY